MVHRHRHAGPAEARDQLGGLLDRLGTLVVRAQAATRAASSRTDHRRARLAESSRDAPPGTPGRSRDDRDTTAQRIGIR